MKKKKLRFCADSDALRTHGNSSVAQETDGLTWTFYAILRRKSEQPGEVVVRLECGPTDKSMIYMFNALVRFDSKCGNRKKSVMKRWKDSLTDEDPRTNYLSDNFVLDTPDFNSNGDISFSVDLTYQILECYANLPLFEFKDEILTDFRFIVGNKTFYVGKDILALNSRNIYTKLYEGQFCIDENGKQLDHLVVDVVEPELFHKFLGMMLGHKVSSIEEDEFIGFVELSNMFLSDKCLQECEIAYFKMDRPAKGKQRLAAEKLDVAKKFLEKLDEKFENEKLMKTTSGVYKQCNLPLRNFERTIQIDNVSFEIKCTFDKQSNHQILKFECLYKDASDVWKHNATIKYTNNLKKKQEVLMTFTASHPTFSAVIPCVDRFGMKLDSSWGTYEEREHSFDKHIEKLTDVVLSVPRKKFHVNKQILANASKVFHSKFSGFSWEKRFEIELEDTDSVSAREFLRHIYNPKQAIKEKNLEALHELARFFDVPAIRSKYVQFMNKKTSREQSPYSMETTKLRKRKCDKELSPYQMKKAMLYDEEYEELTKRMRSNSTEKLKSHLNCIF